MDNQIKLVINNDILNKYYKYFLKKVPKKKKETYRKDLSLLRLINWMVMPRFQMNNQKQIWKEVWGMVSFCYGYQNMRIDKCNITIIYLF